MHRVFPRSLLGKSAVHVGTSGRGWKMRKSPELRGGLLALAIVRIIIGIAAIRLAPFLYKKHFVVLVLMRPTKEVLLAAGFLIRLDKVWWVPVLAAAVPL